MDQTTDNKDFQPHPHSHDMCCGHWGGHGPLRWLLCLVAVVLIFAFGFALGRLSGFGHSRGFRGGYGNMMYFRGQPMMPGYQLNQTPGGLPGRGMMQFYGTAPTTTPAK